MSTRAGEGYGDDDRLPWLETVEDDYREGPGIGRIVLLVALAVAVLAAIGFGWWWLDRQQGETGTGELIEAQEGDYKVKPDEPGGMKVEGEGGAAYHAGEGTLGNASIEAGAGPEAPVQGRKAAAPVTKGSPAAKAALPVPASGGRLEARAPSVAAPASGGGAGSLVQLGAFPDAASADAAWSQLVKRHGFLAPLGKSVQKADSNGRTVFRLRVNAGSNLQAKDMCAKLRAVGQACYVAN